MTLHPAIKVEAKAHSRSVVPENAHLEVRRNPAVLRAYIGFVTDLPGQQTVFEVTLTEEFRLELVNHLRMMLAGSSHTFKVQAGGGGRPLLSVHGEHSQELRIYRTTLAEYGKDGLIVTDPWKIWVLNQQETQELIGHLS